MSRKMSAREGMRERYLARWLSRAGGSSSVRNLASSSARHRSNTSWASSVNRTAGMASSLIFTVRAEFLGIKGVQLFKDLVGFVPRLCVGSAVNVAPGCGRVGPHEQLEALQQAVVSLLSPGGLVDVGRQRSWLNAPQDREAEGRDVQRAPAYPVHVEAPVAVPAL